MAKKSITLKRKHNAFFTEKRHSSKDFTPWIEEFAPLAIEDLAVHKKKISEVQSWIQNFFSPQDKKISPILILTGPPGVGKTATVKVICKSLNAELFVWSNSHQEKTWKPNYVEFINDKQNFVESENETLAFSRFMLHSSKYSLLSGHKRVILVEEFPNAFLRNPNEFHLIMRKYSLCVNSRYPAIFIISDNTKGDSEESRLFPKDLQTSLRIANISFNPVAPTMLMKILLRINNSSKLNSECMKLSKTQLESIASDSKGDIRNAINTMQFLSITQFSESKCDQKKDLTAKTEECALKRDSSLFLFHALGKILYCKRDPSLKSERDVLPAKMKSFERDPLIENPEDVYQKTSISADGFNLFLQENYISFIEDINIVANASVWFSEADVLSSYWNGQETLHEYSVSLASRGLMFSIVSLPSGRRWRSLHKPQFYENNKKRNRLINTLKHNFKGTCLSMREIQIDLVPFLPKLQSKSYNCAQVSLAKDIGEMNVKRLIRPISKTLDEKECFQFEGNEPGNDVVESLNDGKKFEEAITQISDEEIVIEEYDF